MHIYGLDFIKVHLKYFLSLCYKPRVMSSFETVKYIIDNKVSISRFGDGEIFLLDNQDMCFQKHSEKMREKLLAIKTTDKCLVCIPEYISHIDKLKLTKEAVLFWHNHRIHHLPKWKKYFPNNYVYGNTNFTRFYIDFTSHDNLDDYIGLLKSIWDKKNVLFVEGFKTRLGCGNDLFNNCSSIKRILCPNLNAFDTFNRIKHCVINNTKSDDLIIIALGPTATILAYELSQEGFWALDLGHIDIEYEWFLKGSTKKDSIAGKYVNESNNEKMDEIINDKSYINQIIEVIE